MQNIFLMASNLIQNMRLSVYYQHINLMQIGLYYVTQMEALFNEIYEIVKSVIKMGIPGKKLGIHSHNDTENAVAIVLLHNRSGKTNTRNNKWFGERCGNMQPISIIPNLILKNILIMSLKLILI